MGLKSLCAAVGMLLCATLHGAESAAMRTIAKAGFSGIREECRLVITNKTDWEALWQKHSARVEPKPAVPEIDFAKETVLAVAQGQKKSGGYSIEITNVNQDAGGTVVTLHERTPKPGGITIQALTAPVHIVAVPKITGKVEFKVE